MKQYYIAVQYTVQCDFIKLLKLNKHQNICLCKTTMLKDQLKLAKDVELNCKSFL